MYVIQLTTEVMPANQLLITWQRLRTNTDYSNYDLSHPVLRYMPTWVQNNDVITFMT